MACLCDLNIRNLWPAIIRSNRSEVPNKVLKESDLTVKSNTAPIKTPELLVEKAPIASGWCQIRLALLRLQVQNTWLI
jgi:hypothetical protein